MQLEKRYLNDDTVGMQKEDSPWKSIIATSAVIAGGVLAYKSGLLKKGVSELFEYADDFKAVYPEATKIFRNWANQYKDGIKHVDSLVRNASLLSFDSIFNKESRHRLTEYSKKLFNSTTRAEIIKETKEDFADLVGAINKRKATEELRRLNMIDKDYGDTTFMYTINQLKKGYKNIGGELGPKAEEAAKNQGMKDFIEAMTLSAEKAAKQSKRNGYKNITLGDMFDTVTKDGVSVVIPKDVDMKIDNKVFGAIKDLLNTSFVDHDGITKTLISSNKYKDIIFDNSIFINQAGKVADLRRFGKGFENFVHSLATDFQIPVIGINPLRLFGLDDIKEPIQRFGTLQKGTFQGAIEGSKEALKKSLFFSNGSVYDIAENGAISKIKSNMTAQRINRNSKYLNRELESFRKMMNLDRFEVEKYTKADGKLKYTYGKVMEFLDIGFSDINNMSNRHLGLGDYLNPNTYIEKFTSKLFRGPLKPYKGDPQKKFKDFYNVFGGALDDSSPPILIALNESVKIKDLVNGKAKASQFFGQFVAGRHNLENVTKATTHSFFLFDRVNSTLNIAGLGLSIKNLDSSQGILKNLILKRALPVYMAYNAYEYMNYMFEDEKTGNNPTKTMAKLAVQTKLGVAKIKDTFGITALAKKISEYTPGFDQIAELPAVNTLDLSKSYEELKEYYASGYDPIRKGRYWDIGNTAFTGGKIQYFKPNWYRRVMADVKFSDSQYGSRDEYFANSPVPNLYHPFSPIKHFITDKYHWEKKHYKDRPYLLSSPAFSNVPVVGPLLSSTAGQIIKPQIRMHKGEEDKLDPNGITGVSNDDITVANEVIAGSRIEIAKANSMQNALYTTASGKVSVVGVDKSQTVDNVRQQLNNHGIKSIIGVTDRLKMNTGIIEEKLDYSNPNFLPAIGDTYNNVTDFLGIYGYAGRTVTGKANENKIYIETSGYAQSMGKEFWDAEIGGLGGEISEIFRRFIPKRGQNDRYYNPIRNTMPDWVPGSNYFTDFKHGDPYVKISSGEMRLPGEGYERLNNIDIYNMGIGSSFIGKSVEDIVKHYKNEDIVLEDSFGDQVTSEGNKLHNKIEKEWLESGYAIDTEGQINDPINNIIGYYDARVRDDSAPGGQAIKDIKTVSDNVFNKVKTGGILEHHKRQVNYYLWATGLQRGGIHYVNRDTGETFDYDFNYDAKTLNDTMKNLYTARETILTGLKNGNISRGDLYKPLDKLSILGDVAPYSDEYRQMNALVSRMKLTEEEETKYKAIKERVHQQKEPMRLYQYKFKTADLLQEKVNFKRLYDNNTIYVSGFNAPIRFAGIEVRAGDTPEEKEEIRKYLESIFFNGAVLNIGVDKSANQQIKNGSIRAVVTAQGMNVNRELVRLGYAKINEDDNSAAAINVRYNQAERIFGSVWETFAHADTPFHTKFLQVRSPLESYERERVYGKQFPEWSDPVSDFIQPYVIDRNVNRGFVPGMIWGVVIGSMFGKKGFGKIVGGALGGLTVAAGKVMAARYESVNNERWKPERVRKDNEINEYIDMLKYVKSKKLFNEYADKALSEDGINVRAFINSKKKQGRERKNDRKNLEKVKRNIKSSGLFMGSVKSIIDGNAEYVPNVIQSEKDALRGINKEIEQTRNHREILAGFSFNNKQVDFEALDRIQSLYSLMNTVQDTKADNQTIISELSNVKPKYAKIRSERNIDRTQLAGQIAKEINDLTEESNLSTNVVKAIQYYNQADQTMYGYDKGEPMTNLLAAMPKRDRDYFQYFVNAPEEEKLKILEMAPKYMRRPLEATWGMEVEKKTNILEYFKEHSLPDAHWVGWNENVNLNAVRVKMIKKEELDFSDTNVWDQDIKQANAAGEIPIPKLNYRSRANQIKGDLYDILGKIGMEDIRIDMSYQNTDTTVDLDLKYNIREKIKRQLKEREERLIE